MRIIPLDIVADHLVGQHRGRPALFDTGCPMTIPAPAMIAHELGRPIHWLVGNDTLGRTPFIVDWSGRRIVLEAPPFPGPSVALRSQLGLYRTEIEVEAAGVHEAIIDTAAPISYGPAGAFAGLQKVGRRTDFHPLLGRFETDIYQARVTVGALSFDCTFGELPAELQAILPLAGSNGWIIGSDLFRDRAVRMDYNAGTLTDVTASLCAQDASYSKAGPGGRQKMMDAYSAAERILSAELSEEDRRILSELGDRDVVIVRGGYDRVEDVFRLAGIRHAVIAPEAVAAQNLNPDQLLIINCPGKLDAAGISAVRKFVGEGGSLITTDWALKHVVEPAFPGFVAHNGRSTADEVVGVQVFDAGHPFMAGLQRSNGSAVVARGRELSHQHSEPGRGENSAFQQRPRVATRGVTDCSDVLLRCGNCAPHDLALLPAACRAA